MSYWRNIASFEVNIGPNRVFLWHQLSTVNTEPEILGPREIQPSQGCIFPRTQNWGSVFLYDPVGIICIFTTQYNRYCIFMKKYSIVAFQIQIIISNELGIFSVFHHLCTKQPSNLPGKIQHNIVVLNQLRRILQCQRTIA